MSVRTVPYWTFALLTLIALQAIWRRDVLIQPPYWSSALGVFTQASSIATGDVGPEATAAPATFAISLVPRLLAGVMQALPPGTPTILTFRLISFAMAALTLLAVVAILYRTCGWTRALLTAAALITTPLFAVQAELMTEQIFLSAAVAWAVVAFVSRYHLVAASLGLLAFFFHWLGILYLGSAAIVLTVRSVIAAPSRSLAGLLFHLVGLIIAAIVMFTSSIPDHPSAGWIPTASFGTSPITDAWRWTPDLLLLAAVTLALSLFSMRPNRSMRTDVYVDSPIPLNVLMLAGLVGLLSITGAVPGHFTLAVPLLWIAFTAAANQPSWLRAITPPVLYALVAINLYNVNGTLFPPLADVPGVEQRTGALRERSREYLAADHAFNVDAVREILLRCQGRRIVAPTPFIYFLSLPKLGYVTEPFDGYSLDDDHLPRFSPIDTIRNDDFHPLAFIYLRNRFTQSPTQPMPSPTKGDHPIFPRDPLVFEKPAFQSSPMYVFIPRETPSDAASQAKRNYLRRIWPQDILLHQAAQFISEGNLREAEPLLKKALEVAPSNHAARFQWAILCEQQGRFDEALALYQEIPRSAPEYWRAENQVAQILTNTGKFDQSLPHHRAAFEACQKSRGYQPGYGAQVLVCWANAQIGKEDFDDAATKLRQAINLAPGLAMAHRELGFVLYKQQKLQDAMASLEKSQKLDENDPITYRYFGATWGALGNWEKSADAFRQALLLYPSDAQSLDGLITALLKQGRYDEVIEEMEDAMAARPDETLHVTFLLGLAEALGSRGDNPRALATLKRAVELAPDSKDAANQLAWFLSTCPDDQIRSGTQAMDAAKILADDEDNSIYLDTRAAVHAELGQWDQAIQLATKAVDISRSKSLNNRLAEFQQRLDLYKKHLPYRAPIATSTH
jgi:tetratricopeptide (TPR) repeat protein